jgi:hypothetical protein
MIASVWVRATGYVVRPDSTLGRSGAGESAMGKELREKRGWRSLGRPRLNLFSPPRLEIKPPSIALGGASCLGRMTARPCGSAVGAGV